MAQRDVNPLQSRLMRLSARFKSAWAFHQLLLGIQRINAETQFENKSADFQSLHGRLKQLSEAVSLGAGGKAQLESQIEAVEQTVDGLVAGLKENDRTISPSVLRRFLSQIRSLDERILIEVVRFYLDLDEDPEPNADRLDKIDFLISRLAEAVAGPHLEGDRTRLGKVLQALAESTGADVGQIELQSLTSTLQDLRSEVRWVTTLEELNERRLVPLYRALKHDMGFKMFHPGLLPLVVEVNGVFKRRVLELREKEETRILEEYKQLTQLHQESAHIPADLAHELSSLQKKVQKFRQQVKESNVKLTELFELGQTLRDLASRFESRATTGDGSGVVVAMSEPPRAVSGTSRAAMVPDLELLQPFWGELLAALSGLNLGMSTQEAGTAASLAAFRLEPGELAAFRKLGSSNQSLRDQAQFVLAAAVLRRRICHHVDEVRGMLSEAAGTVPDLVLVEARETARVADAYLKHFSHLIDQAVFDRNLDHARGLQVLQIRLMREISGLLILIPRLFSHVRATASLFEEETVGGSADFTEEAGVPLVGKRDTGKSAVS